MTSEQPLPHWSRRPFYSGSDLVGDLKGPEVVLFVDCFNRYFEPDNLRAAVDVLVSAGRRVRFVERARENVRPLCCGKTFLSVGLVEEARHEASRLVKAASRWVERDVPIIGLEPSCVFTLREELPELNIDGAGVAANTFLVEEYLMKEHQAGRLVLDFKGGNESRILVHGHCHQKAAGAFAPTIDALQLIPGTKVKAIESTCCGMAGSFGYQADTQKVGQDIGELDLFPAIRESSEDTLLVADGTSCRHQVAAMTERNARHAIVVIRDALSKEEGLL
ncbi:uncharacterized protein METZ01_LOCUS376517 [marine metagenome]|uniref:Cysteine-rich domain-containing protein n=1 Tax=marine metagenome TaxID=408172 RepID=A0A382TNY2_9ZZZZ